jgi:hypothetical protein
MLLATGVFCAFMWLTVTSMDVDGGSTLLFCCSVAGGLFLSAKAVAYLCKGLVRGDDNAWCEDGSTYRHGRALMLLGGVIAFVVLGLVLGLYLASPWREVESLERKAWAASAAGDHDRAGELRERAKTLKITLLKKEADEAEKAGDLGRAARLSAEADLLD